MATDERRRHLPPPITWPAQRPGFVQKASAPPHCLPPARFAPQRAAIQRMEKPSGEFGYNGAPLKPFLRDSQGKPLTNLPPSKNPNTTSGVYVYQATRYVSLPSIIQSGLDPNYGGGNTGASVLDVSPEKIEESKKGSTGVVTVATKNMVVSSYAKKFDDKAESSNRLLGDYAVVLRIRNAEDFRDWRKDKQDQRGNYQTPNRIPPDHIEFLTFSGWVPITQINLGALSAALREPSFLDDYVPMNNDVYRRLTLDLGPTSSSSRPKRGGCTLL